MNINYQQIVGSFVFGFMLLFSLACATSLEEEKKEECTVCNRRMDAALNFERNHLLRYRAFNTAEGRQVREEFLQYIDHYHPEGKGAMTRPLIFAYIKQISINLCIYEPLNYLRPNGEISVSYFSPILISRQQAWNNINADVLTCLRQFLIPREIRKMRLMNRFCANIFK